MRVRWALASLLAAAAVLCACGAEGQAVAAPRLQYATATATVPATATATPRPAPTARPSVRLAAVGDIMLARSVAGHVTTSDPAGPLAHVRELLRGFDITVGNLESALATGGAAVAKTYTFRGPPLAAEGLAGAGFDVVGMANNHAMDFGSGAMLETAGHLAAAGVLQAGAGIDDQAAHAPALLEREGWRFAFLSFTDVPVETGRAGWTAGPGKPGLAWWDPVTSTAAIAGAATRAEFVVVLVHFGQEYAAGPSARQREIGRAAIDAGASLVLGTHPHVLQEVEEYGGGLIAYSLGNFVFDGFAGDANRSAVLSVTLGAGGVEAWEMIPVAIGGDGRPRPVDP